MDNFFSQIRFKTCSAFYYHDCKSELSMSWQMPGSGDFEKIFFLMFWIHSLVDKLGKVGDTFLMYHWFHVCYLKFITTQKDQMESLLNNNTNCSWILQVWKTSKSIHIQHSILWVARILTELLNWICHLFKIQSYKAMEVLMCYTLLVVMLLT